MKFSRAGGEQHLSKNKVPRMSNHFPTLKLVQVGEKRLGGGGVKGGHGERLMLVFLADGTLVLSMGAGAQVEDSACSFALLTPR